MKKVLLVVLVNIAVLALLLAVTEFTLRALHIPYREDFTPSENALARFDDETGWSYIPGLSREISAGTGSIRIAFDRNGIRVPAAETLLSPTAPSVLFIGCSYTMGHGLNYEESFVGKFGKRVGNSYQMINAGVQAYGTDQALLTLKRIAPQFNTRVVVYTFIEDHITRNGNYDRRYLYPEAKILGTKPLFVLDRDGALRLARKPLRYPEYRNSYLYDLLRMKIEYALDLQPPYPVDLTKALIREMDRYCRERGIAFVLLNWRWTEEDFDDFRELTAARIDTLDGAPEGWASMMLPGDVHPDENASSHAAGLLYGYFRKTGLLKGR